AVQVRPRQERPVGRQQLLVARVHLHGSVVVVDQPIRDLFFFFSSRRRHTRSVSAFLLNRSSDLLLITFLKASHSFRNRLLVICKNAYLFATMIMTSVSSPFSCCSGIVRLNLM